MTTRERVLPKRSELKLIGNEWTFSGRNSFLNPTTFPHQVSFQDASPKVRKLAQVVKDESMQDTWNIEDILGFGDEFSPEKSIAVVFTDPTRTKIKDSQFAFDFLTIPTHLANRQPKWYDKIMLGYNYDELKDVLSGTNLRLKAAWAGYNSVDATYIDRLMRNKQAPRYQNGVAYIYLQLDPIEEAVSDIDQDIRLLTREYEGKIRDLNTKREELSQNIVENPVPLFEAETHS